MFKHILLISFVLLFSHCSKFNVLSNVKVEFSSTTTVEGKSIGESIGADFLGELGFSNFNQFDISSSQTFKDEIGDVSRVEYVNLETFTLSVTDNTQDLGFFSSVDFYISIDGESEVLIASSDDFTMSPKSVSLIVDKTIDLTPYIKSQNIKIRSDVSLERPDEDTEIRADLLFLVDAKVIK